MSGKSQFLQSAPPEIEHKDNIKACALEAFKSESNSEDLVLRSDVDAIFAPDAILGCHTKSRTIVGGSLSCSDTRSWQY